MYKAFIKTIIFTFIIAALSALHISAYAAGEIRLVVDGSTVQTDAAPVIVNGRTLVPVRSLFEKLNASVNWIAATAQVVVESGNNKITLTVNSNKAYVNNKTVTLEAAPTIMNDRTYVPVRFISENLGYNVDWNESTRTVYVNSPGSGETVETKNVITDISVSKNSENTVVTIRADKFEKPVFSVASAPKRYIFDFSGAVLKNGDSKIRVSNKDITEVRYADHDNYARIVIESPSDTKYECAYYDGYMTVTVTGQKIDNTKPLVVIDAGHGGWDTGAIGYGDDGTPEIYESKVNLQIAQKVQYYLQNEGISVLMTRSGDYALGNTEMEDLVGRCDIANNANATLFVSIHNNSFTNPEASGTMVLYADLDNKTYSAGVTSKQLAQNILNPLVETMQILNRGVVDSPKMVVLKKTNMPSVLIECAFVSCPTDRAILLDSGRIEHIAMAIASGIIKSIK